MFPPFEDKKLRFFCVKSDTVVPPARLAAVFIDKPLGVLAFCLAYILVMVAFASNAAASGRISLETSLKEDFPLFARITLPRALKSDVEHLRLPTSLELEELGVSPTSLLDSLELTPSVSDRQTYYLTSSRSIKTPNLILYLVHEDIDGRIYHQFKISKLATKTRIEYERKVFDHVTAVKSPLSNISQNQDRSGIGSQNTETSTEVGETSSGLSTVTAKKYDNESASRDATRRSDLVVVTDDLSLVLGEYLRSQRSRVEETKAFADGNTEKSSVSKLSPALTESESSGAMQSLRPAEGIPEDRTDGLKIPSPPLELKVGVAESDIAPIRSEGESSVFGRELGVAEFFLILMGAFATVIFLSLTRFSSGGVARTNIDPDQDRMIRASDVPVKSRDHLVSDLRDTPKVDYGMAFNPPPSKNESEKMQSALAQILLSAAEEAERAEKEEAAGLLSRERAALSKRQQRVLFDCAQELHSIRYSDSKEEVKFQGTSTKPGGQREENSDSESLAREWVDDSSHGDSSSDPRKLRIPVPTKRIDQGSAPGGESPDTAGAHPPRQVRGPSNADKRGKLNPVITKSTKKYEEPVKSKDKEQVPTERVSGATKLSDYELGEQFALASVYLSMGEPDTAREIFKELAVSGNPKEKSEALRVLQESFDD